MTSTLSPQISATARAATHTQAQSAVSEPNLTDSQRVFDAHGRDAVGDPTSASQDQCRLDTQAFGVLAGGFLRDPVLGVLSDVLDDFEKVRIANANRVRILTRTEADSDGETRGFGLTANHPEVAKLIATVDAIGQTEHEAVLNLQRALRKHPLAAFQKRYRGLGEKQFARMLATIGDPYWNELHDRPRTVSELWAYTGFHVFAGAAPKRQRGQKSNWSEDARKRCYVISENLMKGGRQAEDKRGPQDPIADHYRIVYDEARAKYADAVHTVPCVRCGPAGKPAPAGSPISDGHRHARALRAVSKALLKDLWIEARDIYLASGQAFADAHDLLAASDPTSTSGQRAAGIHWTCAAGGFDTSDDGQCASHLQTRCAIVGTQLKAAS